MLASEMNDDNLVIDTSLPPDQQLSKALEVLMKRKQETLRLLQQALPHEDDTPLIV